MNLATVEIEIVFPFSRVKSDYVSVIKEPEKIISHQNYHP